MPTIAGSTDHTGGLCPHDPWRLRRRKRIIHRDTALEPIFSNSLHYDLLYLQSHEKTDVG